MKRTTTFAMFLACLVIVVSMQGACAPVEPHCEYEGKRYASGEAVGKDTGCGACVCLNGGIACPACGPKPHCKYEGKRYAVGDKVGKDTGCGACVCLEGGVACPGCGPEPHCEYGGKRYAVGDKVGKDEGCGACTCREGGMIACPACAPKDQ